MSYSKSYLATQIHAAMASQREATRNATYARAYLVGRRILHGNIAHKQTLLLGRQGMITDFFIDGDDYYINTTAQKIRGKGNLQQSTDQWAPSYDANFQYTNFNDLTLLED